jgi:hypothetical protein
VRDRILCRPAALAALAVVVAAASLVALTAASFAASAQAATIGRTAAVPLAFRTTAFPLAAVDPVERPFWSTLVAPREDTGVHDDAGVRMRLVDGRLYDYPGAQASWGMDNLNSYLVTADTFYLDRAELQAQRLVDTSMHVGDAWFFPSLYRRDRHSFRNDPMTPPWYSCLGQGAGLALFSRLYEVTGDPKWAEASAGAFSAFLVKGPRKGAWLTDVDHGYLWFEEWPKLPFDHTINGFGYATFGVYEYWRVFGDDRGRQLFCGAATTLLHAFPRFRKPGWVSRYCLLHRVGNRKYHLTHRSQFLKLYTLTGDARFARDADLLRQDFPNPGQILGTCRIEPGVYRVWKFRATGEPLASDTLTVETVQEVGISAREMIRGRGIYEKLAEGPAAGFSILERPGRVYCPGQADWADYVPSRRLTLQAGATYTGTVVDAAGAVLDARAVTPDAPRTATFSRRAAVNGVDSLLLDSGELAGCWIPSAGLSTD